MKTSLVTAKDAKNICEICVPLNLKSHTLNIYRVRDLSNICHLFFSWGFDGIFILGFFGKKYFWEKRKVHTTGIGLECSYNLERGRSPRLRHISRKMPTGTPASAAPRPT